MPNFVLLFPGIKWAEKAMKLLSGLIRVEYKINEMKIIVPIPLVTCYVKYIVNVFAS